MSRDCRNQFLEGREVESREDKGLAIVLCDTQARDLEFPDGVGPHSVKCPL